MTSAADQAPGRLGRRRLLKRVVIAAVAVVALVIVVRTLRDVDWRSVADALGQLNAWQLPALIGVLLVRQLLNSVPLALMVPGLGLGRAVLNDATANLIAYVAPPPSDMVMRMSMFRSWSVDLMKGMAGVTLNMVTFYAVRFSTPVIGVLILTFDHFPVRRVPVALGSAVISVALLVGLALVMKGDRPAALIGTTAGRVVTRFKSSVDPAAWAASLVQLRHNSTDVVRRGLAPSLVSLLGMVLTDATIVLLSLRFVGVDRASLPLWLVIGSFFLVYPLTLFPAQGLGVLDAALVGLLTVSGTELEADVVAALVVWRVITLLVPLVLAVPVLITWRRSARTNSDATRPDSR
ncbi:MAG: lysylphosphatidylglycerol synthase domain-containing protein [Propionibacteriaceae bacterium]